MKQDEDKNEEAKMNPEEAAGRAKTDEAGMFSMPGPAGEARNWRGMAIGFAVVAVVLLLIVVLGRGNREAARTADPYASSLVVEQAQVSQAENFVGTTVTYIDVTVRNNGPRTVVGGLVAATFRNELGEVVQTEVMPLRALAPHSLGGEAEAADLAAAPLVSGQSRVLRLTIEHISSQWNQTRPELEFRGLRLK